jgi:type III pantothenate kinase
MIADINFLLVGNSRLHWAENLETKYKFFHTQKNNNVPQNINLNNLIWASVGKLPDFSLKQENRISTQDIKLKNLPNHFGVDRALGCLEALRIIENPSRKELLIADCGTTLSLTKLTAQGSIIGGQITPGFLTQLRSMEKYTKNLEAPKKYDIPLQDFLINTEDSMLKGVSNSLMGVINLSFNPTKDILIMCGGDSELIGSLLKQKKEEIIIAPNLVMQGMITHFKH